MAAIYSHVTGKDAQRWAKAVTVDTIFPSTGYCHNGRSINDMTGTLGLGINAPSPTCNMVWPGGYTLWSWTKIEDGDNPIISFVYIYLFESRVILFKRVVSVLKRIDFSILCSRISMKPP